MPSKKSTLKGIVNGQVTELYPKTSADNVFLNSGTDVETALTTIPTTETVEGLISIAISELINDAPETYDTLKEISDWISTHESAYEGLLADLANKVDKVTGKGLSTNDYTDAEKTKLAGIAEGANAYTLPIAGASTLGGIKIGDGISVNSTTGVASVPEATSSTSGLMTAAEKTKLSGIAEGANAYSLPTASASTLGGVKVGSNLAIDSSTGVLSGNYSAATTSASGLMSSTDKSKLDGIAANANNYSLPTAAAGTLGGVKVGSNLSIDSSGVLSGSYSNATTSAAGLMSASDKTALDGKPDVYVQSSQPSGLKAGDIWFQISD